jgi:hypothetical protein
MLAEAVTAGVAARDQTHPAQMRAQFVRDQVGEHGTAERSGAESLKRGGHETHEEKILIGAATAFAGRNQCVPRIVVDARVGIP